METSRRNFIAGGVGAAVAAGLLSGQGFAEGTPSASEAGNLKVVQDFCDAWESMDFDKIYAPAADDIVFRMTETTPPINGKVALIEGTKQFLASAKSARFEVLRAQAIGNIVINERIDHFDMGETQNAFHVTGVFFLKDGKIQEWSDYLIADAGGH